MWYLWRLLLQGVQHVWLYRQELHEVGCTPIFLAKDLPEAKML